MASKAACKRANHAANSGRLPNHAWLLCAVGAYFFGACSGDCPKNYVREGSICKSMITGTVLQGGDASVNPDGGRDSGSKLAADGGEGRAGRAGGSEGGKSAGASGSNDGGHAGTTTQSAPDGGGTSLGGSGGGAGGSHGSSSAGMSGASAPLKCTQECCADSDCPSGATCQQNKCQCASGQHACKDACVDSRAVSSCGTSCDACAAPTGGSATCDGTQCGVGCPAGTRVCAGQCIDASMPCNNMCPGGTHACSNNCVSNSSVNACGSSCEPCSPPAHGTATCDGTSCEFSCSSTYKKCDANCIPAQGACCTSADCNASDHEVCDTTAHSCGCDANYKMCNGSCIPSGSCCASSECSGGKVCDSTSHACACDANSKACGSTCVAKTACCAGTDSGNKCTLAAGGAGFCNDAGSCVQCVADADCSASSQHCNIQRNVCVACRTASDCPGMFATCDSGGTCGIGAGCGNGRLDPGEECDVGATGPGSTVKWTSDYCTSGCDSRIYVTPNSAIGSGCTAPRVTNASITFCTVACTTDADCPTLGSSFEAPRCNLSGQGMCDLPCSGNNQCLTSSGETCLTLNGLTPPQTLCANPGF